MAEVRPFHEVGMMVRRRRLTAILGLAAGAMFLLSHRPRTAAAQTAPAASPADQTAVAYGAETVARYRFGAKVVAGAGAVGKIKVVVATPLECPEQSVTLLDEDRSPQVDGVEFRQPDDGVRQMVIAISQLAAGQEAHAYATYEVRTRTVIAPRETKGLTTPKKPDRTLRRYLAASPMIDVGNRKIRTAVDEALAATNQSPSEATGDWDRIEALYDYALKHVHYELGDDKSSIQALADGKGDCQAIAALFVAMCRTYKAPARMVWVNGHQYAEFYLESAPGHGSWYPVESAGTRSFGAMPLARVILQKGDSIRVPDRPREQLRYASDYTVFLSRPTTPPQVTYVRTELK